MIYTLRGLATHVFHSKHSRQTASLVSTEASGRILLVREYPGHRFTLADVDDRDRRLPWSIVRRFDPVSSA
jgi:hypothetical protein